MTIAYDLAHRGIPSILIERNPVTTSHPKMDITNGRSMELFRRVGLVDALRAVAVDETHCFDVSWITALAGHELHRFRYPGVVEYRAIIRRTNDGTQPREPGMRVSQVEIEPVLKRAVDASSWVDVRFGVEFNRSRNRTTASSRPCGTSRQIKATRLRANICSVATAATARCGNQIEIPLFGEARIMPRFMTHFRSDARHLLQRWGAAWHYQSVNGTLIAQNDRDIWTLHSRFPPRATPESIAPSALLARFAGEPFEHQILVANHWTRICWWQIVTATAAC